MNPSRPTYSPRKGFTLVELMSAMAILSILLVVSATMIAQMNQAWVSSQQRLENFQKGRAILELMARELTAAAISNNLQFVQNPAISTLLPSGTSQVANSDSLFWQMPSKANSYGNMYETGYFLTTTPATATTAATYQLQRFNVAPGPPVLGTTAKNSHGASNVTYWIYDPYTAYPISPVYTAYPWPLYSDAPWLTRLTAANFQSCCSTVADGVIGFWIRCLDKNGDAIPWLYQQTALYTVSSLKFNSAASFNPATLGVASSFVYTSPPGGTAIAPTGTTAANRLPSAVELTIVTLDSRTLGQPNLTIPVIPAASGATDVPRQIQAFMTALAIGTPPIKTARVFSTTVRLMNGTD